MKSVKLAVMAITVLMAVVCAPWRATAADNSAVMAVVNGAVASFNKGDMKTWETFCTSPASIVSNVPPYQYYGSTACADWWTSHAAYDKKNGVSGEVVVLGPVWHTEVTGNRAYVAFPASYTFKQKGKTVKTSGNALTIALQKTATGWLMTGWSWTQHP